MRALDKPSWPIVEDLMRSAQNKLKRIVPGHVADAGGDSAEDLGLADGLLSDLSEVMLTQFGEDPLGKFDTKIALVASKGYALEVDPHSSIIMLSERFIQGIEFAVAQAALVNITRKLREKLVEINDTSGFLDSLNQSRTALYGVFISRLLLHILGEQPAPMIAQYLPRSRKLFVHHQLAMCLTFALLHEQAHIEIAAGRAGTTSDIPFDGFVSASPTETQSEEYHADAWAVHQIATRRPFFVKAASFFFLNQWLLDYLLHTPASDHPPSFNRIQRLQAVVPELRDYDPTFYEIMTSGLNKQSLLRQAIIEKDQALRYAKVTKFCRSLGSHPMYEETVDAVCRAYEEFSGE